ncbi:MAG: hypothetical protein FWH51_00920 [Dehalococcoidia bacterium]|nr:hypothetical protein [Dehalococcoidia bacterium]
MARKYVTPKKKRSHTVAPAHHKLPESAPLASPEISVAYSSAAKATPTPVAAESVKYESLPRELRRTALLTVITIAIMIVLWLIFR